MECLHSHLSSQKVVCLCSFLVVTSESGGQVYNAVCLGTCIFEEGRECSVLCKALCDQSFHVGQHWEDQVCECLLRCSVSEKLNLP